MKRSESINELSTALAKAQAVMAGAAKDSDNPFFKSRYADLASCWAAWRPAGPPNGLALMQFVTATEERLDPPIQVQADDNRKAKTIHFIQRVSVETLLCHGDQWVSETLTVLVKDDSPQSTILGETYCRRGGMCAVIGIAPEDDDGDAAANHGAESGERRTKAPKPNCPKCETNTHVYEDRQKGGFFCWKAKGGCGHNWLAEDEKPTEADAKAKAEADKLAAEHGMTTADQLPTNGKPELPRPDKNAVFESWATFILQITPDSFDSDLGSIRATLKEGKIKPPHVEPILRAAAKRAETAGQFDMLDQLILPLKETIRADDEGWTKLAIDIDKAREVRLGDPVPA